MLMSIQTSAAEGSCQPKKGRAWGSAQFLNCDACTGKKKHRLHRWTMHFMYDKLYHLLCWLIYESIKLWFWYGNRHYWRILTLYKPCVAIGMEYSMFHQKEFHFNEMILMIAVSFTNLGFYTYKLKTVNYLLYRHVRTTKFNFMLRQGKLTKMDFVIFFFWI